MMKRCLQDSIQKMESRISRAMLTLRSSNKWRQRALPTSLSIISRSSTGQVKTTRRVPKESVCWMEMTSNRGRWPYSLTRMASIGKRTNLCNSNLSSNSSRDNNHKTPKWITPTFRGLDMARMGIICLLARDNQSKEGCLPNRRT